MANTVDQAVLAALEDQIKRGEGQNVKRFLTSLNIRTIERKFALSLANLCRRVNITQFGLRILNPIMRSEKGARIPATVAEKAEYAVLLQRVGAVDEAIAILKSLNQASCAESPLYLAFCFFAKWDYASAIPYLRAYISDARLPDYQKVVGQVNLSAALVHEEEHGEAEKLLQEIHDVSKAGNYLLLYGNSLEIRAQLEISTGNYVKARKFIGLASENLTRFKSLDEFFVRKWASVATCLEEKDARVLNRIRTEAHELKHWETVRDCDFFSALVSRDRELFQKIYFGTPYPAYRSKLRRNFSWEVEFPNHYIFGERRQDGAILDVSDPGLFSDGDKDAMPVGHLMHRALIVLARDFYRPQRMGALFSALYPNEYFHPHSSPDRIHQLILRMRRWIASCKVPLAISEEAGGYSLGLSPELGLRVPREPLPLNAEELLLVKLRSVFPAGEFSAGAVQKELDCSYTSVNRLLTWALKAKRVVRCGAGPKTFYRLTV